MLFIFEGPAFAGKTTSIKKLDNMLSGIIVIPEWLNKKHIMNLGNCYKNDFQKIQLYKASKENIVLMDRSLFSTGVYDFLRHKKDKFDINFIKGLKVIHQDIGDEELYIFLFMIDYDTGLKRGRTLTRYKDSLIRYNNLEKTYSVYYEAFKLYPGIINIIEIDSRKTLEQIYFILYSFISGKKL